MVTCSTLLLSGVCMQWYNYKIARSPAPYRGFYWWAQRASTGDLEGTARYGHICDVSIYLSAVHSPIKVMSGSPVSNKMGIRNNEMVLDSSKDPQNK